jgi:hypothetical protein
MEETQQNQSNLQELLFEYEQLRKENLQNETVVLQIMGASAVLVTAILGVVFSETVQKSSGKGFLLFVATIVLLTGMSQIIDRWRTTFRIASYLRTFDEGKLKIVRWETRLARLREIGPREEGFGSTSAYQLATFAFLAVATFLLGTGYVVQDIQASPPALRLYRWPNSCGHHHSKDAL